MYELMQVSEHCYYIQSPAKIGLIRLDDTEVCLIDSGSDKDAAKKALKHITANHWTLKAIYNTHSHADHIGGNQYLQRQTGCAVYAPGVECAFTRHTLLEPCFLYGGMPPEELKHKFLMAKESDAQPLTQEKLPAGVEALPLPGHCFDMVGFRAPEDVVYLADCLSSVETLHKYRIGYLQDVGAYLETLETVKRMQAALFVPSHAEPTCDIAPLAQKNIDSTMENAACILDLCCEPATTEAIVQGVFRDYGLTMTFQQYALIGSTVRSYLTWLKGRGEVEAVFDNNLLLWHRV